ncbi:MAG: HAD family phosphatase [Pedosphaera parvula]|nr:HAD family phosphatase [Pedosphaera parvula]
MALPIQLVSTDFDGTLFAEFENPPVPQSLQAIIGSLQARGVRWVINTGRDLSSLMETLGRAHLSIHPDYLVIVEREIYQREGSRYVELEEWNNHCTRSHQDLFARVRPDVQRLMDWINERFVATLYEDPYSPFCLIAESNHDADSILTFLEDYARSIPHLSVVRNDVYARFSHDAFNKGTALAEIARVTGIDRGQIVAAGDHINDLPMLRTEHARWLIAPANAVDAVKESVLQQDGYVSHQPYGHGVARGLEFVLETSGTDQAGSKSV